MGTKLTVEVWSDIACPWCYVGKRRLEAALARFARRDDVEVIYRAFELDPSAPAVRPPMCYAERLAQKYGTSAAQGQAMVERMVNLAASEGLAFDFERIQPGNTFHAHRLLQLARERGRQAELKERLLCAYLCEGQAIGDVQTLRRLGSEVALDPDEVESVLATDAYAEAVRAEEREAHSVGVQGVPFFLIGRRYAASGAQPAELLLEGLTRAFADLDGGLLEADGPVCSPDSPC